MDLIYEFSENMAEVPVAAIALGTFDGVHKGHQKIIGRAVELAQAEGGRSMVFTFSNHPLATLTPHKSPQMLTTLNAKRECIASLGVDCLGLIPFTDGLLKLTPAEFIALLCKKFSPRYIVVGPNYTFGYKGAGTVATLAEHAAAFGYTLEVPAAVMLDEVMISSTAIRRLVQNGAVAKAGRMLQRPVRVAGIVEQVIGDWSRPNYRRLIVETEQQMAIPGEGLYEGLITVENKCCNALIQLGGMISRGDGIVQVEVEIWTFRPGKIFTGSKALRFVNIDFFRLLERTSRLPEGQQQLV